MSTDSWAHVSDFVGIRHLALFKSYLNGHFQISVRSNTDPEIHLGLKSLNILKQQQKKNQRDVLNYSNKRNVIPPLLGVKGSL